MTIYGTQDAKIKNEIFGMTRPDQPSLWN